jgi:hypothetical protein
VNGFKRRSAPWIGREGKVLELRDRMVVAINGSIA